MGQGWWWLVALAVVVVALLVAVALLRARRLRADAAPRSDVETAAAGGAVGAGGADSSDGDREPLREDPVTGADEGVPGHTDPQAAGPVDGYAAADEAQPATGAPHSPIDSDGLVPRSEQRMPDPGDSALAALDSGIVGSPSSLAAAAAAVSAVTARPGPYPGSLLPSADGSAPSPDYLVKANEGSGRYHTPDSPYYVRTRGDAWFRTAEEARAAGFTAWDASR